jgi:uncharacterized protein YodC (DUF2158 family)
MWVSKKEYVKMQTLLANLQKDACSLRAQNDYFVHQTTCYPREPRTGDSVKLKTGGPEMVVRSVDKTGRVDADWYDFQHNVFHTASFQREQLLFTKMRNLPHAP